jgi:lycopene beta-cyclase
LGLELDVEPSTAPETPILMDARVPQTDGFRFFYVVPLAPGRVLVEDTYFSDNKRLDRPVLRREILAYAASLGLSVRGIAREECGVLPIPSHAVADPGSEERLVRTGYQGGFFHPTTGYSFELALRVANEVARSTPEELAERLRRLARTEARQQRYAALLNRLMFRAFAPERRFGALEHFYRLPGPVVRRFYTLSLKGADRARILCGRPPRGFSLTRLFTTRGSQPFVPKSSGDNA